MSSDSIHHCRELTGKIGGDYVAVGSAKQQWVPPFVATVETRMAAGCQTKV